MTVGEAYSESVEFLVEHGFDRHEAQVSTRIGIDKILEIPYAHLVAPELSFDDEQRVDLHLFCLELIRGAPLFYLLGKIEFFGLQFCCDERALIPRPETETLVENAIARLKNHAAPLVADLGTGSGCIAISVAHELPQAVVYATDASRDALELAEKNARNLGVRSRVDFFEGGTGNWATPLLREGFAGKFDAILSNPPYIATTEIETLQTQIREYEPRAALDGGADGLDCYRQIASQCGELLALGGFLMCELGAGQFADVRASFESHGWRVEEPIPDLSRIERVLCATR